jgi:hypothetical protein
LMDGWRCLWGGKELDTEIRSKRASMGFYARRQQGLY